jgi:hypothetical protein
MSGVETVEGLLKEATGLLKSDLRAAIAKLEVALQHATELGDAGAVVTVLEELSRAWARRKVFARSLYYARKSTLLLPERKAAWNTLAKVCELLATRTTHASKRARAKALYRAAASAFKKAAELTKDAEDRRWLSELARDAARQGT